MPVPPADSDEDDHFFVPDAPPADSTYRLAAAMGVQPKKEDEEVLATFTTVPNEDDDDKKKDERVPPAGVPVTVLHKKNGSRSLKDLQPQPRGMPYATLVKIALEYPGRKR